MRYCHIGDINLQDLMERGEISGKQYWSEHKKDKESGGDDAGRIGG